MDTEESRLAQCSYMRHFPLGKVVWMKQQLSVQPQVGHVVGFDFNEHDEITVRVQWADKRTYTVHPIQLIWSIDYE